MCGCGGADETKAESTTQVPQRILDAYYGLMDRAVTQSNQPFQPYTGQRVAGFNPDQDAAFQRVRDSQGIGQPYVDAAFTAAQRGAAPVTWQDVETAYNPTIDAQVGRLQNDFATQNERERATVNSNAAKIGALTGSRSQVAGILSDESQRRQQDPIIANLRSQSYDRAWQGAEGNRDAAAKGAQVYSTLGQQAQGMAGEDIQRLLATGGAQQQNEQANADWGYSQYQQQQAYPYQQLAFALPFTQAGAGMATQSNQTTTQPDSTLGNVLGLGATVLGGFLSDERAKENIVPIGQTNDGQTIYRYNYIGDPTTQIGLIAQEVEASHPEAVGNMGGLKTVNYDLATRDAVEPEHKRNEGGYAYGGTVTTRMPGDDSGLGRMMASLGDAVGTIRGQMQAQPGFSGGGLVVPSVMPKDLGAATYVPTMQASPTAALSSPQMQAPQQGDDSQMWGTLNKGASAFGKWMQPKGDVGLGSWAPTVSFAADGGRIDGYAYGGSVDPFMVEIPEVASGSSFAKPMVKSFSAGASDVPGSVVEGGSRPARTASAVKSYDSAPIQSMGTNYVPAPVQASVDPLQAPAIASPSVGQSAKAPAWYEPHDGKGYFDANSNPDLGIALATAGAAMMGNRGTLAQKLGRGVGTGVGTYLSQAEAVRESQRQDRLLDAKAAEMRAQTQRHLDETRHRDRSLDETIRHNKAVENRATNPTTDDIKEYQFAVENGFVGTPLDFWNARNKRKDETTLSREEAKRAVASVDKYRTAADSARGGLADVAQMRELRKIVPYEGGWFVDARTSLGRNVGSMLGWAPGIPTSDEAAAAEAVRSKATEMQLNFTDATKGAISDAEMRLFGTATPGLQMSDKGADMILNGMEAGYRRTVERSNFYQAYLNANKSLAGADETWDRYVQENPILTKDRETDQLTINSKNIGNWKRYVVKDDAPQVGDIVDGYAYKGGDPGDKSNWEKR